MKTKMFVTVLLALAMQLAAIAQDEGTPRVLPDYVSEKGWWVVESNIHQPKQHVLYFYNNDAVLVYKEKLEGIRFNASKRATKMLLKKALETSVLAWENKQAVKEGQGLVLNSLQRRN